MAGKKKSAFSAPPTIDDTLGALDKAEAETLERHGVVVKKEESEPQAPKKQLNLKVTEEFFFEFKLFATKQRKKMNALAEEILTDYMEKSGEKAQ